VAEILQQFIRLIYHNFQGVFFQWTNRLLMLLGVTSILALIHPQSKVKRQLLILFTLLATITLSGAVRIENYPDQLRVQTDITGFILIFILAVAVTEVAGIYLQNWKFVRLLAFGTLLGIFVLSSMQSWSYHFWKEEYYSYPHYQDVAKYILRTTPDYSFMTSVYDSDLFGKEHALTLPLELISGQQFTRFYENYDDGFTSFNPAPTRAILVCSTLDAPNPTQFCDEALQSLRLPYRYPEFQRIENGMCYSTFEIYWLRQK